MASSMHLSSVVQYKRLLGHEELRRVAGALVNGRMLDEPLSEDMLAELTYEGHVLLNQVPVVPITKLAREEHVDSFFRTGLIRLGTFKYYRAFEHTEIGDSSEGSVLAVGQGPRSTVFADMAGGFDNYVFCCYAGEVDASDLQDRFGYDAGFEVLNVPAFVRSISNALDARSMSYSACVYRKHKVVVSLAPHGVLTSEVSAKLLDLVSAAKYFVKPDVYSHQAEFRMIWRAAGDVEHPLDVHCPEAASFCRRL